MSCWPSLELNRACEWCSSPDFMRGEIEDYLHKPLDEWQELLLDLCYCYDCVQEYHRLADEAKQNNQCSAMVKAHVIIIIIIIMMMIILIIIIIVIGVFKFKLQVYFSNKDLISTMYAAHV